MVGDEERRRHSLHRDGLSTNQISLTRKQVRQNCVSSRAFLEMIMGTQ